VPLRYKEDITLRKLADRLPNQLKSQKWNDPHVKVNLLLNAHMARIQLSAELTRDTELAVLKAVRLVQACVDVLSSNGWLSPAIHAMELSQMLTQAMFASEPYLKQLPHCTPALLTRCKEKKVESVFELLELEDADRDQLLSMNRDQMADVARFCNNYPSIELKHHLSTDRPTIGEPLEIVVSLERENDINGLAPPVVAPFYPQKRKEEGWWLVVGEPNTNQLLSIKRLAVNAEAEAKLDFVPASAGKFDYKLYFMCDGYLGADQEFDFTVRVQEAPERKERKRRHED